MKSKPKAPYVIAVICSLAVILVAYAFFFVPKLNETAALDKKIAAVDATNGTLQTKADTLKSKVDHLPEAAAQVADFNKSFPSDASQQDLIASILDAASATGVTVSGINPSAPAPVTGADQAAAPTPPAPAPAPASSGTPTDPGAGVGTTAAPAPAASDFSKVLAAVPLTVNASGDPGALVVFMQRIESLKRPFTVSEVTLVRSSDGTGLLTLTGQSFLTAPLPAPTVSKAPAEASPAPAATASSAATPATSPAATSPAPSPTPSK